MPRLHVMSDAAEFVPMPLHIAHRDNIRRRFIRRGQRIFGESARLNGAYVVVRGAAMIVRNGFIVDFVESGELLDSRIWPDATAIAYADCLLMPQTQANQ